MLTAEQMAALAAEIAKPDYAGLDDVALHAKGAERTIAGHRVVPVVEVERKLFELQIYGLLDDARSGGADWTTAQRRAAKNFMGALAAFAQGFDFRVEAYRTMIASYLDQCIEAGGGLMDGTKKSDLLALGDTMISTWEAIGCAGATSGDISRARPNTINGIVFEVRNIQGDVVGVTIEHDDGTVDARTPEEHAAATAGG